MGPVTSLSVVSEGTTLGETSRAVYKLVKDGANEAPKSKINRHVLFWAANPRGEAALTVSDTQPIGCRGRER